MSNAPSLLVVLLGLPLLSFAFGWCVLGRFTDLDGEERFAAAWGVGFAFFGLAEFIAFLAHAPQGLFNVAAALLMGILALVCQLDRQPNKPLTSDFWWLAGLWALGMAHLVAVQALLPFYVGGDWWGDWSMHYQAAQVFLGTRSDDWAFMGQFTVASRTPLFNLIAGFGLSFTGEHFWVFQILASWMNWCFPAALYLVLRDLCGPRVGRIALLLASLNLWMLHLAWFTWPKLLAAYFLLLGLHFYLSSLRLRHTNPSAARRRFLLFFASGLLGVLSHSVGIAYVAPLLLHVAVTAWREHRCWLHLKDLAASGLTAALLLGPWSAWLIWRFGLDEISKASPVTIMRAELAEGPTNRILPWLGVIAKNAATSVAPAADTTTQRAADVPDFLYLYATGFYFNSLTGALSLTVTAFLACRAFHHLWLGAKTTFSPQHTVSSDCSAIWLFTGIGCLGALLLHPGSSVHGLAHNAFFTSAVLLVALAWAALARAPRGWCLAVGAGMLLEFLLMFWSHVWFADSPDFLDSTGFNAAGKREQSLVFLRDLLADWAYPLVVAAVIGVQTALVVLFVRAMVRHPVRERKSSLGGIVQPDNA